MISSGKQAADVLCDVKQDRGPSSSRHLSSEEFVALLLRNESRVRSFIVSLVLPSGDVDDIFQNACIVALRKLDTFVYEEPSPDEAFVRWLCTIARFEVLQLYRTRRNAKVTFNSALVEELADMQLRELGFLRDRSETLAECIGRLPTRDRGLIYLRYGEGMPVSDMAGSVGLSVNGVYKALDRIRGRLLTCIRMKLDNGGSR